MLKIKKIKKPLFKNMLIAYMMLAVLDIISTVYALSAFSSASEANPLMESVISNYGFLGFAFIRFSLSILVVFLLKMQYEGKNTFEIKMQRRFLLMIGAKKLAEKVGKNSKKWSYFISLFSLIITSYVIFNNFFIISLAHFSNGINFQEEKYFISFVILSAFISVGIWLKTIKKTLVFPMLLIPIASISSLGLILIKGNF